MAPNPFQSVLQFCKTKKTEGSQASAAPHTELVGRQERTWSVCQKWKTAANKIWDWENEKKIYNKGILRYWVREVGTAGEERCQRQPCLFNYQNDASTHWERTSEWQARAALLPQHTDKLAHKHTSTPKAQDQTHWQRGTKREAERAEFCELQHRMWGMCGWQVFPQKMQYFHRKAHFFF